MDKNKGSVSTSELVKYLHPTYANETIVADKDGIRSVPFDELDERTRRKFARNQKLIESYEPCFGLMEHHEFIKPSKSQVHK